MSRSHPSSVFLASPYSRLVSLSCYYSKHGKTRRVFLCFAMWQPPTAYAPSLPSVVHLYPPRYQFSRTLVQMKHTPLPLTITTTAKVSSSPVIKRKWEWSETHVLNRLESDCNF